jgi:hypothetical protein
VLPRRLRLLRKGSWQAEVREQAPVAEPGGEAGDELTLANGAGRGCALAATGTTALIDD